MAQVQFTSQVSQLNDNVYYRSSSGYDLTEPYVGNGGQPTIVGFRFLDIPLPPGATVTECLLQVQARENSWLNLELDVHMELSANAAAWDFESHPYTRVQTTSFYDYEEDVQWTAGEWYTIADLAEPFNEVLALPGWEEGNAVVALVVGAGGDFNRKFIFDYRHDPSVAPRMLITAEVPDEEPEEPEAAPSDVTILTTLMLLRRENKHRVYPRW